MKPSSLLGLATVAIAAGGCTLLLGDVEPTDGPAGTGGQVAASTSSSTASIGSSQSVASSGVGGQGGAPQTVASSVTGSASSTESSVTTGPGPDCAGLHFLAAMDAGCDACAQANCCTALAACPPGSDCDIYYQCQSKCAQADEGCKSNCVTMADPTPYTTLRLCVLNKCPTVNCGLQGYNVCGTNFMATPMQCANCVTTACCTPIANCAADPICQDCAFDQPGCEPGNPNYVNFQSCTSQCNMSCL